MSLRTIPLLFFCLLTPAFGAVDPLAEARAIFDRYVKLELAYDSAMAELYADTAVIKHRRKYPDGRVREVEVTADEYKQLLLESLPESKAEGEINKYSDVTYKIEGVNVRIRADCLYPGESKTFPLILVVGPTLTGEWRILLEITELEEKPDLQAFDSSPREGL